MPIILNISTDKMPISTRHHYEKLVKSFADEVIDLLENEADDEEVVRALCMVVTPPIPGSEADHPIRVANKRIYDAIALRGRRTTLGMYVRDADCKDPSLRLYDHAYRRQLRDTFMTIFPSGEWF